MNSEASPPEFRRNRGAALASVSEYLARTTRYPLMGRAEEVAVARRARAGDASAAHELVTANLRFVAVVAAEFSGYPVPMDDLVQEGNVGLIRAVERFDPERGLRLTTYAVWWIRAYIQNYILKSWSLVKLGTTQAQRKLFFSLARTRRELEKLGEGDSHVVQADDIARKLRVKPSEVREMEQRMGGDVAMDTRVAAVGAVNGAARTIEDILESQFDDPEAQLIRLEVAALVTRRVRAAVARLPEREREIVQKRFLADKRVNQAVMAGKFGVSRQRVCQLEVRAREALRRELADLEAG